MPVAQLRRRPAVFPIVKLALIFLIACDSGKAVMPVADPPPSPAPPPHQVMLRFARSACYGRCPVYGITVYRDGMLDYRGEQFVKTGGPARTQLSQDQIAELEKLLSRRDLPNRDFVTYGATDASSTELAYASPSGELIAIHHYLGDGTAPASLGEVEDGIDRIVNIEGLIGTPAERDKLDRYP